MSTTPHVRVCFSVHCSQWAFVSGLRRLNSGIALFYQHVTPWNAIFRNHWRVIYKVPSTSWIIDDVCTAAKPGYKFEQNIACAACVGASITYRVLYGWALFVMLFSSMLSMVNLELSHESLRAFWAVFGAISDVNNVLADAWSFERHSKTDKWSHCIIWNHRAVSSARLILL